MEKLRRADFRIAPLDHLRAWEHNPKIVKKGDFERLKRQIIELGEYKPLIVTRDARPDYFIVLGGNSRLRALKDLGADVAWISIVDAPDDDARLRYCLSDNDRAGSWDDQALAELIYKAKDTIGDLSIFRIDLAPTLAVEKVLDSFGPSIDSAPEDDVPKLGPHRLVCGDATAAWSYSAVLEGKKADLIFTDPPYNVDYIGQQFAGILNDNMSEDGFIGFCEAWMAHFRDNLKLGGVFYICSGYSSYPPFVYAIKKAGLTYSNPILWIKNNTSMGWPDYHSKTEMLLKGRREKKTATPILYGWNKGRHYFSSDRFEADVWEHPRRAAAKMLHPTQKPLAMVQRAVKNSTRPGELVLDAFAGSGTTMVAAEREGRRAALLELDPYYCDVIIRRYAAQGGATEAEIRATRRRAEIPKADRARMDGQRAGAAVADAKLMRNSKRRSGGDAPIPPAGRGKSRPPLLEGHDPSRALSPESLDGLAGSIPVPLGFREAVVERNIGKGNGNGKAKDTRPSGGSARIRSARAENTTRSSTRGARP